MGKWGHKIVRLMSYVYGRYLKPKIYDVNFIITKASVADGGVLYYKKGEVVFTFYKNSIKKEYFVFMNFDRGKR